MVSIEYIVSGLQRHKNSWPSVAEATGVPIDTLRKIAQGKTKNPRLSTVNRLTQYLKGDK